MTERERITEILENHKHWLDADCAGWSGMRADLHGADLHGADLRGACLRGFRLEYADLSNADLYGADLYSADLRNASLCGADLRNASLCGADLRNADLRGADLRYSDLRGARLRGADLRDADLRGSDLSEAKLQYANLHGAKLPYIPYACPEVGAFTGFKKCRDYVIAELEIPADAKRLSAAGRKCRCDKARVVRFWNYNCTESDKKIAVSKYDHNFVYEVGKTVYAENFEEDRWIECAPGIHFFINFQEAVNY